MSDEYDFDLEEEQFSRQWNGATLRRTAGLALRHWRLLLGFLGGILLVSLMESYMTLLTGRLIDEGIQAADPEALRRVLLEYGALWIVFAFFVYLFIYCAGYLGHAVQYDLRRQMFEHLQRLPLAYYDRTPSGWLQSRVTSDTVRVGDLVSWGFLDLTWSAGAIGTSLIFMYWINWQLALIITLTVPVIGGLAIYFKRRILTQYRLSRQINSKITSSYSQMITGVRVVKALRREDANLRTFRTLTGGMYDASFKAAWLSALFLPVVQLVTAFGIAAIVWVGGWQVQVGGMTIGGIQAFVGYVTFMMWPIQQMAHVYASMQQAVASAERIFSLLDTRPAIVNRPDAIDPGSLRGDIVFEQVRFQYDTGNPVLDGFNLHVRQGETIALVGPTGAGKSTIVNLICRFYEPTGGRILIAGHDYQDMTLHAIQSRIGMVLQTPHLFSGTVLENLRYGRLDATDDELFEAARLAGAHDFIVKLDKGYESSVGEGGVLLSVGQKQLISLARAILAKPDIFIMDEATSSVDTLTEALIQRGMEQLMQGRTSFIIAHRLSTIKNADRILVIEGGRIAEMGSHAELIRQRGHYYELYTKQWRHEREATIEALDWSAELQTAA